MNERAAPPEAPSPQPQPSRRTPVVVTGRDREFLPAALEILETPPPPLPIALMATISACALAALVWSYFGRLDVHATAPGKIETVGYAKVIEPLDPGKVAAIHVEKGQTVKAGDLLSELDPAEANADAVSAQDALNAGLAEMARRRYAIEAVRAAGAAALIASNRLDASSKDNTLATDSSSVENLAGQTDLKVAWDEAVPEPFRLREEAVLRADLAQLSDALKALVRQMAEKLATQKRLDMSIAFQNTLMDTLHQRVSTRQQAIDLNVGTKIDLYNAKEELEKSQSALASDQGQLIETDAALRGVHSEKAKTISQFIADNENKLAEAARKADEARQALAKADARLARTRLYAPTDGASQELDALFLDTGGATIFPLATLLIDGEPHPDDFPCQAIGLAIDSNSGKGCPDRDGCAAVIFALIMPSIARGSFEGARVVLLDWDIQSLAQGGVAPWLSHMRDRAVAWFRRLKPLGGPPVAHIEPAGNGYAIIEAARAQGLNPQEIDTKYVTAGKDARALMVEPHSTTGRVKIGRSPLERRSIYRGAAANHLVRQVTGFRAFDKDAYRREDDLFDAAIYAALITLGDGTEARWSRLKRVA